MLAPQNLNALFFMMRTGQLFISFGAVETAMTTTLKRHLIDNIGHKDGDEGRKAVALATAIYGSMRFSTARDTMNRIMDAEGTPDDIRRAAKAVFDQIGTIGALRDRLAHHATTQDKSVDDRWVNTDYFAVRNLEKARNIGINFVAVKAAAEDLAKAAYHVGMAWGGERLFGERMLEPIQFEYKPAMLETLP